VFYADGLVDEPVADALLAHVEAASGGPLDDDVALVVVSRHT